MLTNEIYVPTQGFDPKKFTKIPAFTEVSGKEFHKLVISDFRMAGKVKDYVNSHALAKQTVGSNYNGYGWEDHTHRFLLKQKDALVVAELLKVRNANYRPPLSREERDNNFIKRLAKLTGITIEQATEVANAKLEDLEKRIEDWVRKQQEHYTKYGQKKLNALYRENPLRRIKDEAHARDILYAYIRHNLTDYESWISEGEDLAEMGEIEYSEIKAYAREHASRGPGIKEVFFDEDHDEDTE